MATGSKDTADKGIMDQVSEFFGGIKGGDILQGINDNRGKIFTGIGAIFGFQQNGAKGAAVYAGMATVASFLLSSFLDKIVGKQTVESKPKPSKTQANASTNTKSKANTQASTDQQLEKEADKLLSQVKEERKAEIAAVKKGAAGVKPEETKTVSTPMTPPNVNETSNTVTVANTA